VAGEPQRDTSADCCDPPGRIHLHPQSRRRARRTDPGPGGRAQSAGRWRIARRYRVRMRARSHAWAVAADRTTGRVTEW